MTGDRRTAASGLRLAARRFGTPLFVTDAADLEAAARAVEAAFPDPWIRQYSVKANDVTAIVARLGRLGLGANVVSRGEWAVARRAGIGNDRITVEGVGKTEADLEAVAHAARDGDPPRWVAIESPAEAAALADHLTRAPRRRNHRPGGGPPSAPGAVPRVDVLYRLNPDVAPETHAGLAVGRGSAKFGMTEPEIAEAIHAGGGPDGPLRPRGVHLHVGSQLLAVDAWRDAVRRGLAVVALLGGSIRTFDTLDAGGGFPVLPSPGAAPDPARFAAELPDLLDALPSDRRPARLAVEPGRALVARAGWLVARVLHVRDRGEPMAILDAGMTELIRPALYGARHPVRALTSLGRPVDGDAGDPADRADVAPIAGDLRPTRVEGPICESTDALGVHDLPPLRRGDLVAIGDAGAYAASIASTYNGRPRPAQVVLEPDGRLVLARRRGRLAGLG